MREVSHHGWYFKEISLRIMADSEIIACKHCGNISKMYIEGDTCVNETRHSSDDDYHPVSGTHYEVLRCPACNKISIVSYFWHEYMDEEDYNEYTFLYPEKPEYPKGLPDHILSSFITAERVKSIDVNACAMSMRRFLEQVCIDRSAKKGSLAQMLADLANKGEIPTKLVKVAEG